MTEQTAAMRAQAEALMKQEARRTLPSLAERPGAGQAAKRSRRGDGAPGEGGVITIMTLPKLDRRLMEEARPSAGRKCFIADLRSARQCGYSPTEQCVQG